MEKFFKKTNELVSRLDETVGLRFDVEMNVLSVGSLQFEQGSGNADNVLKEKVPVGTPFPTLVGEGLVLTPPSKSAGRRRLKISTKRKV